MAQHDYIISNQTFPNTRADINNVLSAISTNNSGTSAPTTQYAGQFWIDTTSSTWTLYIHDGSDDIQFATIDTSANTVNFIDSELGDNSVTTSKIADANVTSAKLSYPLTTFSSTGIDDNADATAVTIDSSENVLVGTTSASGFDSAGLPLIVGSGSTHQGITIFSGTSHQGAIHFADGTGTSSYRGQLNYKHDIDAMTFAVTGSEKMRIDSSGKVGIGTTTLTYALNIKESTGNMRIKTTDGQNVANASTSILEYHGTDNRAGYVGFVGGDMVIHTDTYSAGDIKLSTNGSERMRINSSGSVGIGTSSPSKTLDVAGDAIITKNDTPLYLNRTSSDGEILRFSKDGTPVSSFNVESGSLSIRRSSGTNGLIQTFGQPTHGIVGAIGNTSVDFYITNNSSGSNNTGLLLSNNNKVVPMENASTSDNVTDLGSTTSRWKDLYLGGGLYVGGTGTANKLEDYEEGTWTATVNTASGFSAGVTSGTSTYTKIGNTVWIKTNFNLGNSSGTVTAGDNVTITNLPFAPIAQDNAINNQFRYNENNAILTTTTGSSTSSIFIRVNYVRGSPPRSGGNLCINFNYTTNA